MFNHNWKNRNCNSNKIQTEIGPKPKIQNCYRNHPPFRKNKDRFRCHPPFRRIESVGFYFRIDGSAAMVMSTRGDESILHLFNQFNGFSQSTRHAMHRFSCHFLFLPSKWRENSFAFINRFLKSHRTSYNIKWSFTNTGISWIRPATILFLYSSKSLQY